ncbi:hypothetical protein [Nonomuraea sp. NPDC049400]|uniref:hypothetical protein n=1 Tax=Nonomuraea sp. NPDC049400 TaxID=3364352 RepID=UPI0037964559
MYRSVVVTGVAEDLLNDADVHALLDEERRGGVPGVVDSDVPDGVHVDVRPAAPQGLALANHAMVSSIELR